MNIKWIGVILIISGCGGFGFSMAAHYRAEERTLRELERCLVNMSNELVYRMTPLPDLFHIAAQMTDANLSDLFRNTADALEKLKEPDASSVLQRVLSEDRTLPPASKRIITELGRTLGQFDMSGQLKGIEACIQQARIELAVLSDNKEQRLRSYQTLGLCSGAALAIILF